MRQSLLRFVTIAVALSILMAALPTTAWSQADPTNSTAFSAGGHVLGCPQADGGTLAGVGATVNVNIRDILNNAIGGYPASQIWLSDLGGMIRRCANGSNPTMNTDPLGNTTIGGPLAIGGWANSLQVYVGAGTPLTGPVLPISTNNPDIIADLVVNLCDINEFARDVIGPYTFRSDLVFDGVLNIADIATFAGHICHTCGASVPGATLPTAGARVGIFFDPVGPPYVQRTLATPVGVPFTFWVVPTNLPGASAIDIPLRMDPGIVILSSTAAPPSIVSPFGGGMVLFGAGCFNAPTQNQLIQVTAIATLPGPQRIGFGTPGSACNQIPGPVYNTCVPGACTLHKFVVEGRGTVNGANNTTDWFGSTANSAAGCILACPAGDGGRLDVAGISILATVVDVTGAPVTMLNESDFELDGIPPTSFNISDCQYHVPEFVDVGPGMYRFGGRFSAGGWTQSGLQLKIQGNFLAGPALAIDVVSPDITGDGIVNLSDIGTFASDFFGGYAFRSDFNCDGTLNLSDVAEIALHNGHGFPCVPDPVD